MVLSSIILASFYLLTWGSIKLEPIKIDFRKIPFLSSSHRIGDSEKFITYDEHGRKKVLIADLKVAGRHTDIWVDRNQDVPEASLMRVLNRFDKEIYPKNIEYFANEYGRKRVKRVHILIANIGAIEGYFDPDDLTGLKKRNLIYLNANKVKNQGDVSDAFSTLAHEFAHLLIYIGGGTKIKWLDEGLAVYAEHINGGYPAFYIESFYWNPSVTLDDSFLHTSNSYGAAFLFIAFAAEQVEQSNNSVPSFLQAFFDSSNSLEDIDLVLKEHIRNPRFNSFAEIYKPELLTGYAEKLMH